MKYVALLVEGALDEAVGRRVVGEAGGEVLETYGKRGVGFVEKKIGSFNEAAQGTPILALADLMDTAFDCPVHAVSEWLPHRNEKMMLRMVVREIESWLLADRANIAQFLGVSKKKIPRDPEEVEDPKRRLVNLARSSRYRKIRELLVPADGAPAPQGPGYISEMQKFVRGNWSPEAAAKTSESLARCRATVAAFFESQSMQS